MTSEGNRPLLTFARILGGKLRATSGTAVSASVIKRRQDLVLSDLSEIRASSGKSVSLILTSYLGAVPERRVTCNTPFDGPDGAAPEISFPDYMQRALLFTKASRESLVLALINIDRFLSKCGPSVLRPTSIHRLFFASFVASIKLQDDAFCSNR